ncbi:MAG: hypothetical protein CMG58_02040 [Candidatus Marinimicrobia bacterium]|nr:hypothetical protein [Candidatus Neomarinimicrobiota bacterium]|tara:strand:+ start:8790 stop:10109 length:1320 start_codon:yes stop_codon:yes gene_type:complete
MEKVHILGGGPAGLAAAYFAKIKKIPFSIYEAKSSVGGNCRTLVFDDCNFDTGAHRFHNKNKIATSAIKSLIDNDLISVNAPSKIYWNSTMTPFPLDPKSFISDFHIVDKVKIISENIFNIFLSQKPDLSFKEAAYRKYGKTISEKFLINYTEKLWGVSANILHNEVTGDRFKNLTPLTLIKSLFNQRESNSKHLEGSFLYPKNGYGQIFESIENIISNKIMYNYRIKKIHTKNNSIDQVSFSNGERVKTEKAISTLPLNYFIHILEPSAPEDIITMANSLKFRNLRLAIFTLNCDSFSKNASIYFPEKKFPFTRLYEPKNRSISMAPKGKTCIVIEVPYKDCDKIGEIDDDEFLMSIQNHLSSNNIINRSLFLESKSVVMPNAYPVITKESKINTKKIYKYLKSFKNLKMIGRNAQFKYLHTHHLFNNAFYKINELPS